MRTPATVFAALLLLYPPLAVLLSHAAVPLVIVAALVMLVVDPGVLRSMPRPALLLPMLVALWGTVGAAWSLDPAFSLVAAAKFLGNAVAGAVLVSAALRLEGGGRVVPAAAVAGLGVALAVLAAEYLSGHQVSGLLAEAQGNAPLPSDWKSPLNRGSAAVAVMVWPMAALAGARWGWRGAMPLVLATLVVAALGNSLVAKVALLAGAGVLVVVALLPRASLRLGAGLLAVGMLTAPLMAEPLARLAAPAAEAGHLPSSVHHRLTIWTFTAGFIPQRPLTGFGFNASRFLPGGEQTRSFATHDEAGNAVVMEEQLLPLHPHSAPLQLWVELGLVGVVLAGALPVWCLLRLAVATAGRLHRAATAACFAAACVVSWVSFGFWQTWWQASLWLVAAFALLALKWGRAAPCTSCS